MSTQKQPWPMLDELLQRMSTPSDATPGFMSVVARRLETALASPRKADLQTLNEQIHTLFLGMIRCAPLQAVAAIKGELLPDDPAAAAFSIGQIVFAEMLAADSLYRRSDDDIVSMMQDHKFKPIILSLQTQEMTNVELVNSLSEKAETISRKLRELRAIGVTDFHSVGRNTINFLTPMAASLADQIQLSSTRELSDAANDAVQTPVNAAILAKINGETSSQNRHLLNFDDEKILA